MKQSSEWWLFEEPKEGTVELKDLPVIVFCPTYYHGSDSGYSKYSWSIKEIYDRNGNLLKAVFEKDWTEIATGIAAFNPATGKRYLNNQEQCDQAIRIAPEACPVRVVFQ
ncbi:MAG: hypothetical protein N2559_17355, partial [Anaerolineae bacterium]|nr:hypothetical protein [Anaerolineae bacterium]